MSSKVQLTKPLRALVRRFTGSANVAVWRNIGRGWRASLDTYGEQILLASSPLPTKQEAIADLSAVVVETAKAVLRADGWTFEEE